MAVLFAKNIEEEGRGKSSVPEVKPTPSRFRNAIGKYIVRRSNACVACGKCAEVCAYGVHHLAGKKMARPESYRCIGLECREKGACCVDECPEKALSVGLNPFLEVMRERR